MTGYLSFRNGRQAVNDVAAQLRAEITTQIGHRLETFLQTPNLINQSNANALRLGLLDANDPAALERYFWEQIQIFGTVTSIYFGNTQGGLVDAGREGAAGSLYVIATDGFASGPFRKYATDAQGNRTELLTTVPDFDARTRPWYTEAVETGQAAWSDIYILFTGQDMAIAASRPVYDPTGKLLGVVSNDLFLSHISNFLQDLTIGKTGEAFIVEQSGLLVASSTGERLFTAAEGDQPQRRLFAAESNTPLVRESVDQVVEQFGSLEAIESSRQFEFDLDGGRHFAQVAPFYEEQGLDWLIVVVIPEDDFMAQIKANTRITLWLILAALGLAIAAGILTARWVTQPLLSLNQAAKSLAEGQWTQVITAGRIKEIGELTQSFNTMAFRLTQSLERLTVENTERQRAEEELRQSEARYRAIVEDQTEFICRSTPDHTLTFVNEAYCRFFGRSCQELIGQNLMQFVPAESRQAVQDKQTGLTPDSPVASDVHQECQADGSLHWLHWTDRGIFDETGRLVEIQAVGRDVTKRVQVEAKMRQLSQAVEQSGSTIVITDLEANIEYVNPAFTQITGYTAEEAMRRNPRILQSGLTPPELYDELWATVTTGKVWHGEFINKKKSGELYWESAVVSPVKDEAGEISHYVAVKEDITQRKWAENIMRARLRLLDFAPSHSLHDLLQATLDEVEALTGSTIGFYHFLEADQQTLSLQAWSTNTLQNMCQAEGEGLHYDISEAGVWTDCIHERRPVIHNDYAALPHRKGMPQGHAEVIRQLVVPVFRGERIMAILGVGNKPQDYEAGDIEIVSSLADLAWDIAERKRAEEALRQSQEQYQAVVTNVKEVIFQTDAEGLWTFLNPAWTEVTGFPLEASLGTNFLNYVHPDDRQRNLELFQPLINQEKDYCRHEIRYLTENGGFRWIEVYARLILDEAGRAAGTTGTLMDITERKQAEQALQESHQSLKIALTELKETQEKMVQQERLAAVGQLAAGIAHDFNNILTSILGYAELLQMSPDIPEAVGADLVRIINSGQRAAHLIRQLLDFSRKSIRRPQQLDPVPLIKESVKFLERTIPENIQIHLEIAPAAYLIEADPAQIQQLLTNLVVNARDAMPQGGELTIKVSRKEAEREKTCVICDQAIEGEWECLEVTDTGSGIPPDVLPHIFEPFFTTKKVGDGTGLGLSQVYGIVSQHGGHLTVNSQTGQGTTFAIYLPPMAPGHDSPKPAETTPISLGRGETILLVEDEWSVLEATRAMLKHLGYQVVTAANGREALAVYEARKNEIVLVLSDMVMPDMEGLALFNTLKAQDPEVRVVLMSGYPLGEKGAELLAQGVVDWFQKPIDLQDLARIIHRALPTRRARWG